MSNAAVAMPISQSKVRLDPCMNMMSAQRPISLLIDPAPCKDAESIVGLMNVGDGRRLRKKEKM